MAFKDAVTKTIEYLHLVTFKFSEQLIINN